MLKAFLLKILLPIVAITGVGAAVQTKNDITVGGRTDSAWDITTTYLKTTGFLGYDILVNGVNKYINFNTISGSSGYGFRDNSGNIEFKNSGGAWTGVGTGGGSLASTTINGASAPFTFATGTDTNIGLNITTSTNTVTFTPTWAGTLANSRIASSSYWNSKQDALSFPLATNLGGTGSTTLNTNVVPEGLNLYYLDSRARAALSASNPITYNNLTGAIGWTNSNNYITLASLTASSPLSYNNGTGAFSINTDLSLYNNATSSFITLAQARNGLSSSALGISYATSTGIFSLTSGYNIPLVSSTTNWQSAYNALYPVGTNGYVLQSNGSNPVWVSTSSLGISGGNGTVGSSTAGYLTFYQASGNTVTGTPALVLSGTTLSVIDNIDLATGYFYKYEGSPLITASSSKFNYFFGVNTGNTSVTGSYNTGVGTNNLQSLTNGGNNTSVGAFALATNDTGAYNVAVGNSSLTNNSNGSYNTAVGLGSLFNNSGLRNVALGYQAGYNETGDNKLYIANSNTSSPLIYGDFSTSALTFNGSEHLTGGFYDSVNNIGTSGMVLQTTGTSTLWIATSTLNIPTTAQWLQWNGGSTNLVAATGRTSLGLTDTATLASTTWALASHTQATSTITGIFGVASGGTGASTLTGLLLGNGTSPVTTITNSSANWDTAYTDRLKWDGGATGLTAATGRTSLGLGTMALEANTGSTTITTLGTITTGVWDGTAIAVNKGGTGTTTLPALGQLLMGNASNGYNLVATSALGITLSDTNGTLAVNRGGTGLTTYNLGDMLYASGANTLSALASSTNGKILQLSGGLPSWQATSSLGFGSLALQNVNAAAITGGSINSTTIGATTPSTGVFTNATSTSLTVTATTTLPGGIWKANGNVGIGTTSPSQILTVGNNNQFTVSAAGFATTTGLYINGTIGVSNAATLSSSLSVTGSTTLATTTLDSTTASRLTVIGQTTLGNASTTNLSAATLTTTGTTTLATGGGYTGIGTAAPTVDLDFKYSNPITTTTAATLQVIPGLRLLNINTTVNALNTLSFGISGPKTAGAAIAFQNISPNSGSSGSYGDLLFLMKPNGSSATTEIMRLTSGGNVGIGTTTPATALSVVGTITQSIVKSCTLGLTTDASGSITGCVASDENLKTNINIFPYSDSQVKEMVAALNPIMYQWKDTSVKDDKVHGGFIAQQVQKIYPEAITGGGNGMLAVDPNAINALLARHAQIMQEELDKLSGVQINNLTTWQRILQFFGIK